MSTPLRTGEIRQKTIQQHLVFRLDLCRKGLYRATDMKANLGNRNPLFMSRRSFLQAGTCFVTGSLLALHPFNGACAAQRLVLPMPENPFNSMRMTAQLPRVALIIDDIGNSIERAREFSNLGMPMTFSILPHLPYSCLLSQELHGQGFEIMLHQPMEPYRRDIDPGPGALYVEDGDREIATTIKANLDCVPRAIGVNNHMGSRFTSCPNKVYSALRVIGNKGLCFIDSLTASRSIAFKTARKLRMRTAYRNVFLDSIAEEAFILNQLEKLKISARHRGVAIGIGHPYPETAIALRKFARGWESGRLGVTLVSVTGVFKEALRPAKQRD
jgi:polysaccharide deacetylase 2 family uncharacterized protein YibQ